MKIKAPIVQKAFIVWHDGMLDNNPHLGYRINELPVTYAETANKAKYIASEPHDYELYGDTAQYVDLHVRRAKGADKMLFEDKIITRNQIKELLVERERYNQRLKNLNRYSDDAMFYVQRGYVGNSVCWWGLNSCGYTTDIKKAQQYTKKEIIDGFIDRCKDEDVVWFAEHITDIISNHVNAQNLNYNYKIS